MPRTTEAARDVCADCGRGVRADLLDGGLCWDCAPSWRGRTRQCTLCPACRRRYARDGRVCLRCQARDELRGAALRDWIAALAEGRDAGPCPPEPFAFARMPEAERAAWTRAEVREALARQAQRERERAAQLAAPAATRPSWRARLRA
jgi:hypothetical protein